MLDAFQQTCKEYNLGYASGLWLVSDSLKRQINDLWECFFFFSFLSLLFAVSRVRISK